MCLIIIKFICHIQDLVYRAGDGYKRMSPNGDDSENFSLKSVMEKLQKRKDPVT